MTKTTEATPQNIKPLTVRELDTVTGGRQYGWRGGGWQHDGGTGSGFLAWSKNQPG
jgi:hypothetical protein